MAPTPADNAFTAAAWEGQHEVLIELLAHRKKPHDAAELQQALFKAVYNSHPYEEQRPAEAFERCIKVLLEAGAQTKDGKERGSLVAKAVFTRNPGGNPKVVEMLVAAGADPNPVVGDDGFTRLSDMIAGSCQQRGCGTPLAGTIAAFENAAKVVIKR